MVTKQRAPKYKYTAGVQCGTVIQSQTTDSIIEVELEFMDHYLSS